MTHEMDHLLVVDDEAGIRDLVCTVAKGLGYEVHSAGNAEEFVSILRQVEPNVIILDLNMPGSDGVELLRYLASEGSDARVLVISGEDQRVLNAAERLGASQGLNMAGVMQKPIMLSSLEELLVAAKSQTISAADLAQAIKYGDLLIHYQPLLSIDSRNQWSVDGAEALVRWRHPKLGLLMPGTFIEMAEESGLIAPLTDFVLREVLEQNRVWRDRGLTVNVSVNVAPQLLTDVEFPDRLSVLLQQYDADGNILTLEVTETAAAKDLDSMMDILTRLRLKGVRLAIDDFGTGYSSMKQLFCMPFTELKIDRSFVLEIPRSEEAKTMVAAMISLADNLNLSACAEGVESQEVLDFLELSGCHRIQGYFICKPVPASQFEDFVHAWQQDGGHQLISIGRE
ncbi:MAG: EAL domain-containing response regulator [Woeseiaceae bacterium]|nr:EAL domain-containing response regulator [Woeseiaceae bacterium]